MCCSEYSVSILDYICESRYCTYIPKCVCCYEYSVSILDYICESRYSVSTPNVLDAMSSLYPSLNIFVNLGILYLRLMYWML